MMDHSVKGAARLLQMLATTTCRESTISLAKDVAQDSQTKLSYPSVDALSDISSDSSSFCEKVKSLEGPRTFAIRSISVSTQSIISAHSDRLGPLPSPKYRLTLPGSRPASCNVQPISPPPVRLLLCKEISLKDSISDTRPILSHRKHAPPNGIDKGNLEDRKQKKYVGSTTPHKVRHILRRKFAWKNYPKLEEFLRARREAYLANSLSQNYTPAQKQFNNTLTSELLEIALSSGIVFQGFTFVQVRDRIRCYYKSYVQNLKKRKRMLV